MCQCALLPLQAFSISSYLLPAQGPSPFLLQTYVSRCASGHSRARMLHSQMLTGETTLQTRESLQMYDAPSDGSAFRIVHHHTPLAYGKPYTLLV